MRKRRDVHSCFRRSIRRDAGVVITSLYRPSVTRDTSAGVAKGSAECADKVAPCQPQGRTPSARLAGEHPHLSGPVGQTPGMALRGLAGTVAAGRVAEAMRTLNARHPWSHNDHFHSWIMASLPVRHRTALDVGCGRGELLAVLASVFDNVVGTDRDAGMRARAGSRCAGLTNVTIDDHDLTQLAGPFDLVTMVAVLHHLEIGEALREVRRVLAPGGRFLAVGLAPPRSPRDHLWDLASIVTNPLIGYVKNPWPSQNRPQPPPFPVAEPTLSFDQVYRQVVHVMPGAVMRHQLGFRHTIAWSKPPDL